MFSCRYILRTLGMLVVTATGAALWIFLGAELYWIPLLFGISLPIYLCAMMYSKVFEKLEDQIKEREAAEKGDDLIEENVV